ncbi:MAG: hypothetical protein K1Y01_11315 [Vicinamibacteria bacterium]|nr:hypothetical protein [Vicinamibacteria bacterium]
MKVISFSLWGANPKYTAGAVRNAELALRIYPGWVCRFHCGSSVPEQTLARLRQFPNVELRLRDEPGDWSGLFWRFDAAGDPLVEVMISRDADSRLNPRERAAVDAWLASDASFHVMRDHPDHDTPILGGLWGAKRGAIPDMSALVGSWEKADRWGPDQDFLTAVIAPRVRGSWLEHDPYFARRPFPTRRRGRQFVGQPFDETDTPLIVGPRDIETWARRWARRSLSWALSGSRGY